MAQDGVVPWGCNWRLMQIAVPKVGRVTAWRGVEWWPHASLRHLCHSALPRAALSCGAAGLVTPSSYMTRNSFFLHDS